MGVIVVDTSVLIDNLRADPDAVVALDRARDDRNQVVASVITKAELLAGMRAREPRTTYALLDVIDWVAVSEEIADLGGAMARRYRTSHQGIGLPDYLIAATAEHLGAELWTRNPRHFPMFPDLRPPY
jgi:predicted nucleic acid-binding protein